MVVFESEEMERDCLVAHGVSLLLVERMLLSSDPLLQVCVTRWYSAYSGYCQYCKNGHSVSDFRIPVRASHCFRSSVSMNVQPKIRLREGGFFDTSSVLGGKKRVRSMKKNQKQRQKHAT